MHDYAKLHKSHCYTVHVPGLILNTYIKCVNINNSNKRLLLISKIHKENTRTNETYGTESRATGSFRE